MPWTSLIQTWIKVWLLFTPKSPSCPNTPIAPTCAEKQLELFKKESRNLHLRGCAAWIAHGLDIHQSQLSSKVSCLNINSFNAKAISCYGSLQEKDSIFRTGAGSRTQARCTQDQN